jgi:hypothetical protein
MKKYTIIAIIVNIIAIILWFSAMDKISNLKAENVALIEMYRDSQEENDTLYQFIENIDTFKTLDDAVESSQDLMDYIQFRDE